MLEVLKALLLGIVQGITEWLPISSTGHLLLLDELISLSIGSKGKELFMVIIQLASILAVVILYFSLLNPFSVEKDKTEKTKTWILWAKVLVASIPTGIAGILLNDYMDTYLYKWQVIVAALALYGVFYIVLEKKGRGTKEPRITSLDSLSYKDATAMGFFQMLALVAWDKQIRFNHPRRNSPGYRQEHSCAVLFLHGYSCHGRGIVAETAEAGVHVHEE